MLPPFKIRQLRLRNPFGPPDEGQAQTVVRISSSDYDNTILKCPEAALSYMDEDDGEIVTVGSSLELQQRLDEPIPLPSTSSVSASMHIFDMNTKANGALDVWRKIATLPSDDLLTRTGAGGEWWRDSITNLEAKRQRYFEATQPPQPAKEHGNTQFTRDRLLYPDLEPALNPRKDTLLQGALPVLLDQSNFTQSNGGLDSILTNEGRKQARDAGAKLRSSINPSNSKDHRVVQPEKVAHQNRWASYGRTSDCSSNQVAREAETDKSTGELPFSVTIDPALAKPLTTSTMGNTPQSWQTQKPLTASTKGKTPIIRQSQKPLLEAFEAELAELVKNCPQDSARDHGKASNTNDAAFLVASTKSSTSPDIPQAFVNEESPSTSELPLASSITSPGDIFSQTIRSFVDGVGLLTSDLRTTFPEAHGQIAVAQQHMPQAVGQVIQGAFRGFEARVQSLANFVQEATVAAGDVADRTAQIETEALMGAVEGLQNLALGVGEISREIFGTVLSDATAGSREGNGVIIESVEEKDSAVSLSGEVVDASVAADSVDDLNETSEVSVQSAQAGPETLLSEKLQSEIVDSPQKDMADVVEMTSSSHLKTLPRAISQKALPTYAADHKGESKFEEHQALPILADLDALNMSASNKVYSPEEYEIVHRRKRDEAADEREADRQRVRRLLEESKQGEERCSRFIPSTPFGCEAEGLHVNTKPVPMLPTVKADVLVQTPKPDPQFPAPPPTSTELDLLDLSSRACAPGCSLGPSICHKHCTTSDMPYSPRPDFNRGRRPRRSLPLGPHRLPYEYIVPPPGYQNHGGNDKESNIPVVENHDESTRSRSPPVRRNTYRSPLRRPPPGWPRFPRHGPIHLPHDTTSLSSEARFEYRSSNASRVADYPGRLRDPNLGRRHAPRVETEETKVDWQQHQRISALRHRQSWHPGSHGRPVDRLRARVPAGSPVETTNPCSKTFTTAHATKMGELKHSRSSTAAADRKPTFWTHVTSQADDHSSIGRDCSDSSDRANQQPTSFEKYFRHYQPPSVADAGPVPYISAKSSKFADDFNGPSLRQGVETLERANTVAATASDRQRDALRSYHFTPAPPPPLPVHQPASSDELIQPSQFPEMTRFPSLRQFENEPSTFRYSSPFPPLPSMNPLIPSRRSDSIKSPQSNNPFSPQVSMVYKEDGPQICNSSASESKPEASRVENASADLPSLSIERGHEVIPDHLDICAGMKPLPPRPAGLGPPEPGARLARPFDPLDPLTESVTPSRNRLFQGVRRSATERHQQPERVTQHRRPYPRHVDTSRFSLQEPARSFSVIEASRISTKPSTTQSVDYADHHEDIATVGKVQECVDQLKILGFGTEAVGGVGRLVVYAQAADGDLETALEIIEEERKAYQQQNIR